MNLKLSYLTLKCLLSLSHFEQNQKATTKFSKNREKNIIFSTFYPVGIALYRAGVRKDMTMLMGLYFFHLNCSANALNYSLT